jgi:tetratricopeptide (TPR) repeat protein
VQQFAQAKLEQNFDAEGSAVAHSRHFLRLLVEASDRVRQADIEALRQIDEEFENIRAAWRFAVVHGPAEDLVRAAYSLLSHCDHRGRRLECLEMMHKAMEGDCVAGHPKYVSALAANAAWMAFRLDRYAEAETLGKKALNDGAADHRPGESKSGFRASTVLGATCARLGRAEEAQRWFRQALELAQKCADPYDVASALDNLGLIARGRGDLEEALRLYRQALLKHREIGDAGNEAVCLNNQGVVHILRRELDAAQAALGDARILCERLGLQTTRCMVEVNLANVAMMSGAPEVAMRHARQALELSGQTGQRGTGVEARHVLAWAALHQGDLATARSELAAATTVAIAIGRTELLVHGARLFAELLAAQGAPEVAARVMSFALRHPGLVGAEREVAKQQMQTWDARSREDDDWIGPPLDELAHRIVTEVGQGYATLIATLRGGRTVATSPNRSAKVADSTSG